MDSVGFGCAFIWGVEATFTHAGNKCVSYINFNSTHNQDASKCEKLQMVLRRGQAGGEV